jgi:hypothetical protein
MREAGAHIRLISLDRGKARDIEVKGYRGLCSMNRSPDGKAFYCGSVSPEGATLLRIDRLGNAWSLWRQKGEPGLG